MMRQLKKLPSSIVVVAAVGANVTLKETGVEIWTEEEKGRKKKMMKNHSPSSEEEWRKYKENDEIGKEK